MDESAFDLAAELKIEFVSRFMLFCMQFMCMNDERKCTFQYIVDDIVSATTNIISEQYSTDYFVYDCNGNHCDLAGGYLEKSI